MAGDWIKMRIGLADDPAVISISLATKLDVDTVVGKLHRIWCWADQNTSDGRLNGVPASWIDNKIGKRGFANAMANTDPPWLLIDDSGVTIPKYERHNGKAAKSRADATERQRVSRKSRDNPVTDVTDNARQNRDQRREEKSIIPAPGAGDWQRARQKANELAEFLGPAFDERDRRLLLGLAFLSQNETFQAMWIEIGRRETKAARPDKPYAFFQKVVTNAADEDGFNLKGSIARVDIPADLLKRKTAPA